MEIDRDFALALQLQEQFEEELKACEILPESPMPHSSRPTSHEVPGAKAPKRPRKSDNRKENVDGNYPISIVDESWELVDPNPNAHSLFLHFNDAFFGGKLVGVEVRWSRRMTTCAGICHYEGRGGLCSVRLSEPLLKLRPRKDLVQTLLHEMIHAYLFVTDNNKDHDGHGPEFHKHMQTINKMTGANITVYHTFHDEVRLYKTHWWRCDGPCQDRQPYFGYVKRASNRAPAPNDLWWAEHQKTCGGQFVKIKEPENYQKKRKGGASATKVASPVKIQKGEGSADIRTFFKTSPTKTQKTLVQSTSSNIHTISSWKDSTKSSPTAKPSSTLIFGGTGQVLGKRKS